MALLFEEYYKGKDKDKFIRGVISIGDALNIPADWLMAIMYSESGFSPSIENSLGFVGLIQFGPQALKDQGLTKSQVKVMSAHDQLIVVYKYYKPFKKHINDFSDLYLITFYPNADKKHAGTLLKGDEWQFPKSIQKANPGMLTDKEAVTNTGEDRLSIASFKVWANNKIPKDGKQKIFEKESSIERKKEDVVKKEDSKRVDDKKYIIYTHVFSDIKTLDELINYKGWHIPGESSIPKGTTLLNFEDNIDSIKSAYSKRKKKEVTSNFENNLVVGTTLKIPINWLIQELIQFDGSSNIFPNDDIETFISDAMLKATKNAKYIKTFKSDNGSGVHSSVSKIITNPRVWIWCKAAGIKPNEGNSPKYRAEGKIFDLSPFIINLNTSVVSGGGSFNFSLPPIICTCTKNGWILDAVAFKQFSSTDGSGNLNFSMKGSVNKETEGDAMYGEISKRNSFFFSQLISHNDVVWISSDNQGDQITPDTDDFSIDIKEIAGKFYDMIGLVDEVSQSFDAKSASAPISVSGRDLMKLLIEESSQYVEVPPSVDNDGKIDGVFLNDNKDGWGRPFRSSIAADNGMVWNLKSAFPRTIGEIASFIISALASIEIAPDSLFSSYKDQEESDKGKAFEDRDGFGISRYEFVNPVTSKTSTFTAAGIWQIIKLQIDNYAVNDRTVFHTKLPVHSGSLNSAMKVIADDHFIEMYGDTYVDQYFLMFRRPPFNKKCVFDYLSKITNDGGKENGQTLFDSTVISDNFKWYDGDVYCWYQLSNPIVAEDGSKFPQISFPTIFFREYCEIWGVKALSIENTYIPLDKMPRNIKKDDPAYNSFKTQFYEDLAYLIESTAYLPFTRMGSITIKGGDNRIKRGTWIRYSPTNEIFYVDAVANSYSISQGGVEKFTTLTVSRGMVEYNNSGQHILPLYFKLINGLGNDIADEREKINVEKFEEKVLEVYFDFDKDVLIDMHRTDLANKDLLNNPEERKRLYNLGEKSLNDLTKDIHDNSQSELKITGNTDENGSASYNQKLSERRAITIKNELIKRYKDIYGTSLDSSRISTEGAGESKLIESSEGRSKVDKEKVDAHNRRIVTSLKTKSNSDNSKPPQANKKNDFSNWFVNQSVFNFFKARRQFCDNIDDFDNISNPVDRQKGASLIVDEPITKSNSKTETLVNEDKFIKAINIASDEISNALFGNIPIGSRYDEYNLPDTSKEEKKK